MILDDNNAPQMLRMKLGDWLAVKHDVDPDAAEYGETKPYACSGNMAITSNPRKKWLQDIMRIDNAAGAACPSSGFRDAYGRFADTPSPSKAQGTRCPAIVERSVWSIACPSSLCRFVAGGG